MPDNKTQATEASVDAFVEALADTNQRADAHALIDLFRGITGEPPVLWGSIIGFGSYHYRYDSGREGDAPRIGFAPRKGKTVLYLFDGFAEHGALVARLGKVKTGVACLYVKRLADVDMTALDELVRASLRAMDARTPRST